jgi:acylphosphatase
MRAQIIIAGVVQGVGYRFYAIHQAQQCNIRGYTRNLPDGTVEVVAEGEKGMLNDFVERLRIGPPTAKVIGIEVSWSEEEHGFDDFGLRF